MGAQKPLSLQENINNLTILINSSPSVLLLTANLHEDLVDVLHSISDPELPDAGENWDGVVEDVIQRWESLA